MVIQFLSEYTMVVFTEGQFYPPIDSNNSKIYQIGGIKSPVHFSFSIVRNLTIIVQTLLPFDNESSDIIYFQTLRISTEVLNRILSSGYKSIPLTPIILIY